MDQYRMTNNLVKWMREHPWKPSLRVRYDGSRTDPNTPDAEQCGLYIGGKKKGEGRISQLAQVDILTEDSKTVDLLIEFEPDNTPKKILGDVLPALLADVFTPSRCCGALNQREIKEAVFLLVTVIGDNQVSKRRQLEQLEQRIRERLDFRELNVRTVRFCLGNSETDALEKCKEHIAALLFERVTD